jgi:hypothetical protein
MRGEGWYRRVVPVTVLVVGLVALLALLSPGVRHQLALSASHRPQQYVELAFARTPSGTVSTCERVGDRVRVAFDVTSHLDRRRHVAYEITVAGRRSPGSVVLDPGETGRVTRLIDRPTHGRYEVRVVLPREDRTVFAHCGSAS